MDDIMVRSRYPRHSIPAKRRSRYGKEKSNLPKLIFRQLAVCLLIFFVIILVKSINTPFTNYITGKVQYVLQQDIQLNSIFKSVDDALGKLKEGTDLKDSAKDQTDKINTTGAPTGNSSDNLSADTGKPETSVLSATTEEGNDSAGNMMVPVKGVLSSPFGERNDPITHELKMHEGIDIEANKGENILAALGGTVVDAGSSPSYGKYLKIRHEGGYETVYAHCSVVSAQQGQKVARGDVIAKVGNTGASVGTHLHFEVWKDGKAVNPLEYITVPLP